MDARRDTPEELKEFLSRTPFFFGLWDRGLEWVARTLVAQEWPAGSTVFRAGDPGHSLFVVRSGELAARSCGCTLMRFGPGDFFGETTVLEMQPRPFTVDVVEPALLHELTNADLYRLYKEDLKAYVLVLQNINRELCRRLRRAGEAIRDAERT